MLNPLAFDSEEEFQRARMEEGLARGWTPIVRNIDTVATHGELVVADILEHQVSDKTGLAIVAIPAEDDYVNKISSEKVPHMTLLFLGETSKVKNISEIVDFVEHASKTLTRFCLEVDHRGTLGPNLADVLYFAKRKWSGFGEVQSFRSNLLKDDNTKIAYDSIEQFPEWIPHLTLGFPDTPANPDERDFPKFYSVEFDRIAVWTGDFEGPEFNLKSWDWGVSDGYAVMSQTASVVSRILSHHGIKGQKWGVRKNQNLSKVTVIDKGKRLKTSGGKGLKADPSAVQARIIGQKAKGSGIKVLSDAELKTYANRLNLEQNVKRLQFADKPAAERFILGLLGQTGKNSANTAANEVVTQNVRRALKVAAIAA